MQNISNFSKKTCRNFPKHAFFTPNSPFHHSNRIRIQKKRHVLAPILFCLNPNLGHVVGILLVILPAFSLPSCRHAAPPRWHFVGNLIGFSPATSLTVVGRLVGFSPAASLAPRLPSSAASLAFRLPLRWHLAYRRRPPRWLFTCHLAGTSMAVVGRLVGFSPPSRWHFTGHLVGFSPVGLLALCSHLVGTLLVLSR